MQLILTGIQGLYLSGNPQITWFKMVYKRYTNFSLESVQQPFTGDVDFGKRLNCTISRNGDLLSRLYVQATLPALVASQTGVTPGRVRWVDKVGHALIKSYEILIGGQSINYNIGR